MGNRDLTRDTKLRQEATLALLVLIGPDIRMDRDLVWVEAERSIYGFDLDSSATADGINIVAPTDGTGRWYRQEASVAGFEPAVQASTVLNPSALVPTAGQRWLIDGTGAGGWLAKDNMIAEYISGTVTLATSWRFIDADDGTIVGVKATGCAVVRRTSGFWNLLGEPMERTRAVRAAGVDRITDLAVATAFALTHPIPADSLVAGDRIKLDVGLTIPSVNAGDTLTLEAMLGGVAGVAVLTVPDAAYAAGDVARMKGTFPVAVIGGSGTVHRDVTYSRTVAGVPVQFAGGEYDLSCPTDVARDLTIVATWSAAHADNQVDLRDFEAVLLGAA